jgi:LysM repeat protein
VNRRQLALIIIMNAIVSLAIAIGVVWVVETRKPDPEELAALEGLPGLPTGVANPAGAGGIDLPPTATAVTVGVVATPAGEQPVAGEPAPTEAQAPAGEPAANSGEEQVYVVQAGDSLSSIADRFGVAQAVIVEANELTDPNFLFSGQPLVIPPAGTQPATATPEPPSPAGIRIRAVNNPGDLTTEHVEIVNDGTVGLNLQGWKVQRAGGPEYTFGDLLLLPGSSVRLYSGTGTDSTIARYWGQSAAVWQSGAQAGLASAQGREIARYVVP